MKICIVILAIIWIMLVISSFVFVSKNEYGKEIRLTTIALIVAMVELPMIGIYYNSSEALYITTGIALAEYVLINIVKILKDKMW